MVLSKFRLRNPIPEEEHIPSVFRRRARTPLTIPALLEQAAFKYPNRVVYQMKQRGQWQFTTFQELHQRAADFAAGLIALGLRQGDRVTICAENGVNWVVAYMGVVMAGGTGVPLYTELKSGEIEELVRRSDSRFLIVSARVLSKLRPNLPGVEKEIVIGDQVTPKAGAHGGFLRRSRPDVVPFENVPAAATDESRRALAAVHIQPDDLASIVFTSGTTGGMKGVMLTHRNLTSNVDSVATTLPVDERDRILMVLPLHHAFPFIVAVLAPLVIGATVAFENDLLRVRDRMEEVKPTVFMGVPALFELMWRNIITRLEAEGRREMFERGLRIVESVKQRTGVNIGRIVFRELHKRLGGHLRFAICGGAALDPQVAANFALVGLPLIQGWGLTEASPVVSAQRWYPRRFYLSNYYEERFGTVGQPLEGVEVGLIDVPEKEIYVHLHGEGELVVRGPNVTPGYWKAPEETRAAKLGEWLRTGDVGRIDEEGNIWITGRSKYVIVLDSGEKVHPDEVEEKIGRSPLVEDVAVIGRRLRNKVVVGAVVYPNFEATKAQLEAEGQPLDEAHIRALISREVAANQEDIAAYKRATDVQITDTPLPKTALRKIARGQLVDSYSFDVKRWRQNSSLAALVGAPEPEEPEPTTDGATPSSETGAV